MRGVVRRLELLWGFLVGLGVCISLAQLAGLGKESGHLAHLADVLRPVARRKARGRR